jgi:hypothetical protein
MVAEVDLPPIETAQAEIEDLAAKVGFMRKSLPRIEDAKRPQAGAAYWTSDYARVLLWPLPSSDASSLEENMLQAEGWLDAALNGDERGVAGSTLDGYLVLAMPSPPLKDAYDEIRRIELSARICRKHLIWPSGDMGQGGARWTRIADVTVLGLPSTDVQAPTGELQWPDLEPLAQEVWQHVSTSGGRDAARREAARLGLDGDQA